MTGIYFIDGAIGLFIVAVCLYVLFRWEWWKASDDER